VTTQTDHSGKKGYHHGDLRQGLIDSALEMLEEVGAEGLSLRGVASRAGVSHAAPYRHFQDKESLLAAVAEDGFHKMFTRMMEAMKGVETPREQLLEMGVAYVGFAQEHPTHLRLMFGPHMASMDRHDCAREAGWICHTKLVEVVRACQAAGDFSTGSAEIIAIGYWSEAQGLATLLINGMLQKKMAMMPEEERDPERLVRAVLGQFIPR
jgi:AcrR family transcriptional regulator